ncbi:MAG: aldehyde:ferredoxin oxidoreductase [Anaerolineae bacterium SM23_ 63]|nr:MAG: aldehyde:ferredoxin oxidoreductase [Anaerolineae bacterium SM23_ 63]
MTTVKSIEELKTAHKLLTEFSYTLQPVERGYANRTLYVNLSENEIREKAVTSQMKEIFTGGRGFALWLLWNAVDGDTRWDDPQNELVIAGGPIGGITAYPGSGKSTVVTISPLTHSVFDSNAGGYFGPYLKFAGWDAIEIQGKAERDVIVVIDGDQGSVTIEEAPLEELNTHLLSEQLTEMYATDGRSKRSISVVSAGQGADHVLFSCLNFSWYDPRREAVRVKQAGRGGTGRVFREKRLKAIVVRYSNLKGESNNPADMALIRKAGKRINKEISDFDDSQNQMRKIGTPYLVEIMDHFDLLPVHNFRYGAHPESPKIDSSVWKNKFTQGMFDGCWAGCTMSCSHAVEHFHLRTGPYANQAVMVDGPEYETVAGLGSNIGIFDPLAIIELNFYCDTYGIDTISLANSIAFTMECYQEGILTKEHTGGLELTWGNADAALELLHQMARGEGFGAIVGQGVRRMKKYLAEEYGADPDFLHDIGMESKGLEFSEYVTKESLAQQGGYAMTLKGAQHDEAWLIFMDQVNNQLPTFEDKAEALHYFPMWRTWFSLHGLCKLPWNDIIPEGNDQTDEPAKVPEHVENYTWLYEGLTGQPVTVDDLVLQSERVYNFQRVFNLKMGFGTREHDYPPYRAAGPVTIEEYESRAERYDDQLRELGIDLENLSTQEKMAHLRKHRGARYEQLVDAVYARRGWDENGIPTMEMVKKLGIDFPDVVKLIEG